MADCHVGSWRDERLRQLSLEAFVKAIDKCISENVDFVLISGDLFNTSMPGIEYQKKVVEKLNELKQKDIPVYIIAGSHDFSPSGKTMIEVYEKAKLFVNVVKGSVENGKLKLRFTTDKKTGAKIAGMLGKKGMLERKYYEDLDKENLEKEEGFKIFMFHTALSEFKPKELEKMDSSPLSLLPKNFDYYAGGHVHIVKEASIGDYKNVVYPGPVFPNNFAELEKLERGGFYIYEDGKLTYEPVQIKNVFKIHVDANHKTTEQITESIMAQIKNREFYETIVLIRVEGTLESGKSSDINFKEIFDVLFSKGAFYVMKSTYKLETKEFEEIKTEIGTTDEIEDSLINENAGQIKLGEMDTDKQKELTKDLMKVLSLEKQEGEKVYEFEARLKAEISKVLRIDL